MGATSDTVVDFWFDPGCPYSWTASRWLREVGQRRPLTVRHHVMSLYLLNQDRSDVAPEYRRDVEASRGPAKVATAVATRGGTEALADFYTAFGKRRVYDVWRRPTAAEYHEVISAALPERWGCLPSWRTPGVRGARRREARQPRRGGGPRGTRRRRHADHLLRRCWVVRSGPQRDPRVESTRSRFSREHACSPANRSSTSSSTPHAAPGLHLKEERWQA